MLPAARCQVVDASALRVPVSAACAHTLTMGAVLIDVASLPAEHDMSHVPPLRISTMRPLALDDEDPMRVHVLVDDTLLSIHTVCEAAEWMGQTIVKRRSRVLRRRTRQGALDKPHVRDGQLRFAILEQKGQKRP